MPATMTVKDLIRMLSDYHPNADLYLDVILPGGTERMTSPIDGVDLHDHIEEYRGSVIVVNARQRLGGDDFYHLRQGALDQLFDRTDEEGSELHGWAGKDDCQGDGVNSRTPVRGSVKPSGPRDIDDVDGDIPEEDWVNDPDTNDTGRSMVTSTGRIMSYSFSSFEPAGSDGSMEHVYTFNKGTTLADVKTARIMLENNGVNLEGYRCQHSYDCCGQWYPSSLSLGEENGRLVGRQSWYQNI